MSTSPPTQMARCCPSHCDWESLARHLVADFDDVPVQAVIDELIRARNACHDFRLADADALHYAELIVRHRLFLATGRVRATSLIDTPPLSAATQVA